MFRSCKDLFFYKKKNKYLNLFKNLILLILIAVVFNIVKNIGY